MVKRDDFDGYARYTICSDGTEVSVMELGAALPGLKFRGRELVLGFDRAEDYVNKVNYICTAIGRYANRIGGARFSLNGREYTLPANEGRNQLHGGPRSYDCRRWSSETVGDSAVRFRLFSPDGDNGFPGNLTAAVTYSLAGDTLRMDFEGESDADTVYAPTSHMYFALGGSALDYELEVAASGWVEVDSELIPTGRILPAEGGFDFSHMRRIGRDYDHCFVLDSENACTVRGGGVSIEMKTDFPAVQIYTASAMEEPFGKNSALAVEPEFLPDSPNKPDFPSTVLKAGEKFHRYAEFKISGI